MGRVAPSSWEREPPPPAVPRLPVGIGQGCPLPPACTLLSARSPAFHILLRALGSCKPLWSACHSAGLGLAFHCLRPPGRLAFFVDAHRIEFSYKKGESEDLRQKFGPLEYGTVEATLAWWLQWGLLHCTRDSAGLSEQRPLALRWQAEGGEVSPVLVAPLVFKAEVIFPPVLALPRHHAPLLGSPSEVLRGPSVSSSVASFLWPLWLAHTRLRCRLCKPSAVAVLLGPHIRRKVGRGRGWQPLGRGGKRENLNLYKKYSGVMRRKRKKTV